MLMEWLTKENQVEETAALFASNIDPDPAYISHSELMGARAVNPHTWSPDLGRVIEREFRELANQATASNKRIARCLVDGALVGVALVAFETDAPIPFAVLEDIAIAREQRGKGIGQTFLNWIFDRARERNIGRVFLESGLRNHAAHHWFEQNGFRQVSMVMMANI